MLDRYLGTPGQDGVLDQAEISELTVKDWTTITKTQTVPIRSRSAESENMCISLLLTETQEKLFRFLKTRLREKGRNSRVTMKTERYTYILREKSVKGADGKELLAGAADAAVGGMGLYVRDDDGSTTASNVITNTYEGRREN